MKRFIVIFSICLASVWLQAEPVRLDVARALRHVSDAIVLVTMDTGILEQHAPGLIFERIDNRVYIVTDAAVVQTPEGQGIHRVWVRYNDRGISKADLLDDQFADGLALLEATFRHPHNPLEQSERHTREDVITGYLWGYPLSDPAVRRLLTKGGGLGASWAISDFQPTRDLLGQVESFHIAYRPVAGEIDGTPGTVAVDRFGDAVGVVSVLEPTADQSLTITPIQDIRASLKGIVRELSFEPIRGRRGYFRVNGRTADPCRRVGAVILTSKRWQRDQAMPLQQADGFWPRMAHDAREQQLDLDGNIISGEIRLRPSSDADEAHLCQIKLLYGDRQPSFCQPQVVHLWGELPDNSNWFAQDYSEHMELRASDVRAGPVETVNKVSLDGRSIIRPMIWSADDRNVLLLHRTGILEERTLPDLGVSRTLKLGRRPVDMARTKLGLAILVDDAVLWIVDERSLKVTRRIPVPGARAIEGNASSYDVLVLTADRDQIDIVSLAGQGTKVLTAKELWMGQKSWVRKHEAAEGHTLAEFSDFSLAPDGRQLLVRSNHCLHRFVFEYRSLHYKEMGPPIGEEPGRLVFTRDSASFGFVNVSDQLLPAHPPVGFGSYIYATRNIQAPVLTLNYGAMPRVVAFNEGIIYAQNKDQRMIRYAPRVGVRDGYRFDTRGRTLDILPVPTSESEEVVILSESDLLWVSF